MKKTLFFILFIVFVAESNAVEKPRALDLTPAKWIWYPSERTLQNTFVLFRKEFNIDKVPQRATGWILADSRYRLYVNGKEIQWGPAPSDPRWQEADSLNIASYLVKGKNVIAVEVCFFGTGEGTYAMGKPGLIVNLDVGEKQIITDQSWNCSLAKSWPQGKYKRWFLRALQEDFDARLYPYGWTNVGFLMSNDWLNAQTVSESGKYPSICNKYNEYMLSIKGDTTISEIRPRSIPLMKTENVPASNLSENYWIHWNRSVEDYFNMMPPNAYDVISKPAATNNNGNWIVNPKGNQAAVLTFEFKEQGVGWPYFTIDAPAGTIIEMLVHEAHQKGKKGLINSHFNAWSRFVCKEGVNHFKTFDFESFRWMQLHIRNFNRPVIVSSVGMQRRFYPWKVNPQITLSDDTIQKLMQANINTLYNCAQETLVDGMARERQQYSGDGSHQLHCIFQAFGDSLSPRRFVNTFSQGSSIEGFFMDSWPGWDRLIRMPERELNLTGWGPILDHSIGFCFDAYYYYLYSGDKKGLVEVYPRLIKFYRYLCSLIKPDNLLPVEGLGMCSVYMDQQAFRKQQHKQLALNLYTVAMFRTALAPLCKLFGDEQLSKEIQGYSDKILKACINKYWDAQQQIFVDNLPWRDLEGETRYSDRSLATVLIYDLSPNGKYEKALDILNKCPIEPGIYSPCNGDKPYMVAVAENAELGISYPCNAVWREWALIKYHLLDTVLRDLKNRCGYMASVWENNTLQEFWNATPDSNSQWSHSAMGPLMALYQGIAGIVPIEAGSKQVKICPQPATLSFAEFDVQTMKGAIHFISKGTKGKRNIELSVPMGITAELWLDNREKVSLPFLRLENDGFNVYRLSGGKNYFLKLKHT